MADHGMSHDEVWDDSALVDSWNEALNEYKKYHSLAVKGEKVPNTSTDKATTSQHSSVKASVAAPSQVGNASSTLPNGQSLHHIETPAPSAGIAGASAPAQGNAPMIGPTMPPGLISNVQDADLKNLMMSWYYAGYYTGLYEGQQKAYAEMQGR